MDQWWRDITFLHWPVDPALVAPLLPRGVRPDLYGGAAWVGLIPFRMVDAGVGSGRPVPWLGTFLETNVRLYSTDDRGRRGVVFCSLDADRLAELGPDPSLFGLFGKGYLAITFDLAETGERYQGIVPLEGESLADAAEHYFFQSEQIPSVIRIATRHDAGEGCVAAGLLLQHLPEGEVGRERLHVRHDHPEWEHVQVLAETLRADELTDAALPLADILWRLFHEEEEVRVTEAAPLAKGCRCDLTHIRDVIGRFSSEERAEMAGDDGVIGVDCAFCSRIFPLALDSFATH